MQNLIASFGIFLVAAFVACNDDETSSCSGETCPTKVPLTEATMQCDLDDDAGTSQSRVAADPPAPAVVIQGGTALHVSAEHVVFRCHQEACAYVTRPSSNKIEVVLQPCDLHPTEVPRCAGCAQKLSVEIDAKPGDYSVEAFQRSDEYAAPSTRKSIGSADVKVE